MTAHDTASISHGLIWDGTFKNSQSPFLLIPKSWQFHEVTPYPFGVWDLPTKSESHESVNFWGIFLPVHQIFSKNPLLHPSLFLYTPHRKKEKPP
jgi:hypothetical protein